MKKRIKIKDAKWLEEFLDWTYQDWVLESNKRLHREARKVKRHFKYALDYLELHDCIKIIRPRKK